MQMHTMRKPLDRSVKYRHVERGFLRMNLCGLRFYLIDSRRHRPVYSVRQSGWWFGPFVFSVSRSRAW
jgi:hypothetical protein